MSKKESINKTTNRRLAYMDVAKGLCMLIIMADHIGVGPLQDSMIAVRVLLYFVISGFFFKWDSVNKSFFKSRFYSLAVPFLIFYIGSYACLYVCKHFVPSIASMTEASGILDIFTQKRLFNGPIWFLASLFFAQIVCFYIQKFPKHLRVLAYFVCGITGWTLSHYLVDLPLTIETSLTAVPLIGLGILRSPSILNLNYGYAY